MVMAIAGKFDLSVSSRRYSVYLFKTTEETSIISVKMYGHSLRLIKTECH